MAMELSAILAVLSTFLGVLFLYSGLAKFFSFGTFVQGLFLVPYLPHRWARQTGALIAALESLVGLGLILNELWAKFAAICLLGVFSGIAWLAIRRNQKVPCNCFGVNDSEYLSTSTIARNAVLVLIAIVSLTVPATYVRWLTEIYGVVSLLMFLIVGKLLQNHRSFVESFKIKLE
jgi:uncharacterized membrane protein YphA (DoxX/SURF4 family)